MARTAAMASPCLAGGKGAKVPRRRVVTLAKTATHERNPDAPHVDTHTHTHTSRHTPSATPTRERTRQGNHRLRDLHRPLRQRLRPLPPLKISQSVSQLFHGPAPRSPLHRLAVRLRHSRSNTSTEYSLPASRGLLNCRK